MNIDSNWDDLRYFNALAQYQTLSETARRLDVSHTTVQRHIANFEHNLQLKLFLQSSTGFNLTAAGKLLFHETSRMQRALKKISHQITDESDELSGVVKLSVSDTFGHFVMPDVIRRIQRLYPKLQIHLIVTNQHSNMQVFDVDIALRASNHPPEELVGRQVGPVKFAMCASREYLKQHGLNAKNASKNAQHVIVLDQNFSKTRFFELMPPSGTDKAVTTVNGFLAAYRLCIANLGITLLPEYIVKLESELVRLEPSINLKNRLWILSHAELRDTPRIRAVRQELFTHLQKLL